MLRRTLLQAVPALAVGRAALAATPRHNPSISRWAVRFNGATYIRNDGFPAGMFPDDPGSPYLMVSFLYRTPGGKPSVGGTVANIVNSTNAMTHAGFAINLSASVGPNHTALLKLDTSFADAYVGGATSPGSIPNDRNLHLVQVATDLTNMNNPIVATLDTVPLAWNGPQPAGDPSHTTIPFYTQNGQSLSHAVGSTSYTNGVHVYSLLDLAELYVYAGTWIDILDPAVQASFWDTTNNQPLEFSYLNSNSSLAIPGITPQIYLSGGANAFCYNNKRGTINDGRVILDPSDPWNFYTAAGALQTTTFTGV